jgi:hypothetical protein
MVSLRLFELSIVTLVYLVTQVDELRLDCVNDVAAGLLEPFVIEYSLVFRRVIPTLTEILLVMPILLLLASGLLSSWLLRLELACFVMNHVRQRLFRFLVSITLFQPVGDNKFVVFDLRVRQELVEEGFQLPLSLFEELLGSVTKVLFAGECGQALLFSD